MKTTIRLKAVLFLVFACIFTTAAWAQMPAAKTKKVLSPRDSVSGKIGTANVTINYGGPSVRGRKIFGALVPYNTVWRTGANEATRFTTDKALTIEGKTLPAGTYGFFAIPTENSWTIIFNSVAKQWGAFKYDASKDVLRVNVKSLYSIPHESLIYRISPNGFELMWDDVKVPITIVAK